MERARLFPVLRGRLLRALPWAFLEPHQRQAERNHQQSLERLAQRGGLGPDESLAVVEDRAYRKMPDAEAEARLMARLIET